MERHNNERFYICLFTGSVPWSDVCHWILRHFNRQFICCISIIYILLCPLHYYLQRNFMANASVKVRKVFQDFSPVLTLSQIREHLPELKASEVSMALCYLMRMRYLSRNPLENNQPKQRKSVWQYTYHAERLPKE